MSNKVPLLLLIFFIQSCIPSPAEIKCTGDLDELKLRLGQLFDAEETFINSIVLKEELYFPTIVAFEITYINPTTATLDFKSLDSTKYVRLENYQEIDNSLQREAEQIVEIVNGNCDLSSFTSVIVIFKRRVEKYELAYSFRSHFELKNYIENHEKTVKY